MEFAAKPLIAQAQGDAITYTVVAGDTLGEIAARFGVPLETIIAFNAITNPDLLHIGQVLLIPSVGSNFAVGDVSRAYVSSRAGDNLEMVARRYNQEPALLAALNSVSETLRLFPGQPLFIPRASLPIPPLRFGAVIQVNTPERIVQGRVGRVLVETRRPITLSGDWNGLPLPFTPFKDDPLRQFALLPAPALLAPDAYTLTLIYTADNGIALAHTWTITVEEGNYERQEITLPPDRGTLLEATLVQAELARVAAAWSQVSSELLWQAPFTRPIGNEYPTTSPFGIRRSYDGGPYNSYHAGQDFGAPAGVSVTVPANGIVVLAAPLEVRGNAILLDHGRGIFTGYWHLNELRVSEGEFVQVGDVLGLVGNTGLSTGAHLHWELRIYGIAVDPMQFIDEPIFYEEIEGLGD